MSVAMRQQCPLFPSCIFPTGQAKKEYVSFTVSMAFSGWLEFRVVYFSLAFFSNSATEGDWMQNHQQRREGVKRQLQQANQVTELGRSGWDVF